MVKNKVINVGFMGGILGLFNTPRARLEKVIQAHNDEGYRAVFILPGNPNPLFMILSLFILVLTAFIYQPLPGYMVLFEKQEK